jgi:hypothetical protein
MILKNDFDETVNKDCIYALFVTPIAFFQAIRYC